MASRWHNQNCSSTDVTNPEEFSSGSRPQPGGAFYDDSLRPKSFLRDEVDEFNRVLAELLESKQRPAAEPPLYSDTDFACCSLWSEDDKVNLFQTAQQDLRLVGSNNFGIEHVADTRTASMLDSQPCFMDTCWTAELSDDDDYAEVADDGDEYDDTLLKIVEEGDCHPLAAKNDNVHCMHAVCRPTDDLLNEVCVGPQNT